MKILLIFLVLEIFTVISSHSSDGGPYSGFPGTAELLKNSRKSRVSKEFASDTAETQSEDTGKLLKNFQPYLDDRDTDKLTDKQKGLLKDIAERIARFGPQIQDDTDESDIENGEARATKVKGLKSGKRVATNKNSPKAKNIQTSTTTSTQLPKINSTKKQTVQIDADDMSTTINDNNATTSAIIDSLSRENAREDFYVRERPQTEMNKLKKSPVTVQQTGTTSGNGTGKPTKYHYYPHNQHIYLLPECAIQQVCNAVYVRLNYTQPLCACPSRYRDPCSASLNEDDLHTTKLIGDAGKKAITLAKTCESTTEMRECRAPKDWSLLALQNTRTGKSHYLVICRCPDHFRLEGPMAHDQPTYASVPGIRVFGMMCVKPGVQIRRPTPQDLPPNKRFQDNQFYNTHNRYKITSLPPYRPTTISTTPSISLAQSDYVQSQYQSNYQYLKRPGSPITKLNANIVKQGNLPTLTYGRSGATEEEIEAEQQTESIQDTESRSKRSLEDDENDYMPEFPWEQVQELQRSLHWF